MNEKKAEAIGKAGESQIAKALEDIPDIYVLRNLYIPSSRGKSSKSTEIDLLVASRKGLLVIESKAWTGWIRGSERLNDWSVKIWPGAKPEKRYSPIKQNRAHIRKLSKFLNLPDDRTPHSIIVFTSSKAELKKVPENTGEFTILKGTSALRTFIQRRLRVRRDIFTERELKQIVEKLKKTPKPTKGLKRTHVANAKKAEEKRLAEKERRRKARKKSAQRKAKAKTAAKKKPRRKGRAAKLSVRSIILKAFAQFT